MIKTSKIVLLVSVFVLFSFSLSEANWWKRPKISKELKLTKENIDAFDKIFSEDREELFARQKEMKQLRTEFSETLKNTKLSKEKRTSELNKTVKKIAALQGNIISKTYSKKIKIINMLSTEQLNALLTKYPNIMQRRWGGRDMKRVKKTREKVSIEKKTDVKE